jgi:hypothetical protein
MLISRRDITIAELAIYYHVFFLSVINGLSYTYRGLAFAWLYITVFYFSKN